VPLRQRATIAWRSGQCRPGHELGCELSCATVTRDIGPAASVTRLKFVGGWRGAVSRRRSWSR